ncbi:class I SAM-dependent methyltransferase [Streptomyces sp. NBC_01571]|uniref:class I SAM-dependent methyltransferase n=1 Tax=Streptomyces sp. NBC_01571 TaxID=2975883 RepID=UPI0022508849|nr:class I SAM-dependent methyltransferase [Streptomyces sp. NBC_01571]MCX4579383.1 class I SAM-dependent methyltransferase [Streptomyces sp. NBC_01571]
MNTPASYFEDMYRRSGDPWHLAERWYERRKYDLTVASLPRRRYRRALEPACSVGELTLRLAERCDEVLACDRVDSAVATAAARTAHLPQVTVRRLTLPAEWPPGTFDLVVLSEVLYYFDKDTLDDVLRRTTAALEPGGTLVTVHWNHPVPEHLRTGDELAGVLASVPGLSPAADHREVDFVLQTFGRTAPDGTPPPSPAAAERLV